MNVLKVLMLWQRNASDLTSGMAEIQHEVTDTDASAKKLVNNIDKFKRV